MSSAYDTEIVLVHRFYDLNSFMRQLLKNGSVQRWFSYTGECWV